MHSVSVIVSSLFQPENVVQLVFLVCTYRATNFTSKIMSVGAENNSCGIFDHFYHQKLLGVIANFLNLCNTGSSHNPNTSHTGMKYSLSLSVWCS